MSVGQSGMSCYNAGVTTWKLNHRGGNMRFIAVVAFAAIAPAGCATTSDIVPVGQGVYEVAGSSATGMSSGGAQKIRLIKVANEFCAKQGKSATLVYANDTNGHVGGFASVNGSSYGNGSSGYVSGFASGPIKRATADVTFRCQ